MGGPCSGQVHDVEPDTAEVSELDEAGDRHRYVRTETVDLWQVHAWDPWTPMDETLAAIDDAVAAGKVRYAGVSNYAGWQMSRAATWQQAVAGRAPLVTAQMEYSLLERGIERGYPRPGGREWGQATPERLGDPLVAGHRGATHHFRP